MLESGKPLPIVKESVKKEISKKVIITVGGAEDLLALNLEASEYSLFDLQNVFRQWSGQLTKSGEKVYQPIELRSLYNHYFNIDIQSRHHSAVSDDKATMRIFREVYTSLALKKNPVAWDYDRCDGEFDDIKTMK